MELKGSEKMVLRLAVQGSSFSLLFCKKGCRLNVYTKGS